MLNHSVYIHVPSHWRFSRRSLICYICVCVCVCAWMSTSCTLVSLRNSFLMLSKNMPIKIQHWKLFLPFNNNSQDITFYITAGNVKATRLLELHIIATVLVWERWKSCIQFNNPWRSRPEKSTPSVEPRRGISSNWKWFFLRLYISQNELFRYLNY